MTLANLLGQAGLRVMLVERDAGTSNEPRAVSFDDESLRTLQLCGLTCDAYDLILQGTGTKYFGMNGRPLAYARGPAHPPLGHPIKNPFSQPKFEQMLLRGLKRFASVEVCLSTELTGLILDERSGAQATLRQADETDRHVKARFVVGCDGGGSTVRTILGIAMDGIGAAVLSAKGNDSLVGKMFPQPTVLRSDGSRLHLDDVLGQGYALLAVAPPRHAFRPPTDQIWTALGPRLVELVLDDRAPRAGGDEVEVVADIDGGLARLLDPYRGQVLLIRPDRFVAGVLSLDLDGAADEVRRALRLPETRANGAQVDRGISTDVELVASQGAVPGES